MNHHTQYITEKTDVAVASWNSHIIRIFVVGFENPFYINDITDYQIVEFNPDNVYIQNLNFFDMIETERLILRHWREKDILPFSEINSDKEVMGYLPKCLSMEEAVQFYNRIVAEHDRFGYGLYAVETKSGGSFIGYVGFHHFDFDAEFSPGVEIGWRLAREHWNSGYATEAAKACLDYARRNRLFNEIYSFTTLCNHRSERVMRKIGMDRVGFFSHPSLPRGHRLEPHVLYKLELCHIYQ